MDLHSDVDLLEGICTTRAIRRYRPRLHADFQVKIQFRWSTHVLALTQRQIL